MAYSFNPFTGTFDIVLDSGQLDNRYYTETEIGSTTVGSSGASLIGLNSLDATAPDVQLSIDGVNSSMHYSGGVVTENVALDGTIDISEIVGAIKTSADNEATAMASFTLAAASSQALSSGINFICVAYAASAVTFTIVTSEPNHSSVMPIARVYKDVNDHLHIQQSGHKFLGHPYKVHKRFAKVYGVERASGLITTESGTHALGLAMTAGVVWKGTAEFDIGDFDSGLYSRITGAGTGGTVSANNTIVLDSGEGDKTDEFCHGCEIWIEDSANSNDGAYHVESSSYSSPNTTVIIEGTGLTTGDDAGAHVHYETFTYWHYRLFDTTWVEEDYQGNHVSSIIDNTYYNDITDADDGDELKAITVNKYGTAWIYRSVTDRSRIHVLYGQGNYTLSQAELAGTPASLPDIVNKMCILVAKVIIQQGAATFLSVSYPWTSTIEATGATDHGGLAGLLDDDHTQYLLASDATSRANFATVFGELDAWIDDVVLADGGAITTTQVATHAQLVLTPRAAALSAVQGGIFYDSDDNSVYVCTEGA